MKQLQPIIVTDLFPELLDHLLVILRELSAEQWAQTTACAGWSVQDIALHLLGIEIGILSRKRDEFSPPASPIRNADELVALVNDLNATWVQATRRISPRLLCDLLRFTGEQTCVYFASLDPYTFGAPVSWAGPDPAPIWLDLAREYTERWHHQQHVRDAVGKPGLKEPGFFAPVLDAFVRALPHTYRQVNAVDGTLVALTISGESGGRWFVLKEAKGWSLYLELAQEPDAEVVIDEDVAWRLFTRGLSAQEAQAHTTILGDRRLGSKVLGMVSIIA